MDVRRILALSIVCTATQASAQSVVAGQGPQLPAQGAISTDEAGGAYIYDDQKLGENLSVPRNATVERIRFWGGSETSAQHDLNTMGFRLTIYQKVGQTLTLAHDRKIARGFSAPMDTAETFGADGARMYEYELDLSHKPIALVAGQEYVVSIAAIHFVAPRSGRESWSWASATGDGAVFVDLFDGLGLALGDAGVTGLAIELVGEMEPAACLADVNGDGALSPADFSAWISAYNLRDPRADQNQDGAFTPADFSAWIANYNAGC